jgi:DNA-binding beta-propeller fold protein YncE
MLLGLNETVVENFVPPARARETLKGRSIFALLRDNIITFAYGHAKMLSTPTHVITDSKGRLIISDPQLSAVHVLDASGKTSFRIAGGPMRRLESPGGLAVDAEDNIYVADPKVGLISVYDPAGKFLRFLGSVNGESMFDSPSGIAIDGKPGRLYVLDTTANELIVLDLHGRVLNRVGGQRSKAGVKLRHPSEITIRKNEIFILDQFGSRIQILDLDCNPISSFSVRNENGPPILTEVGLAVDDHSHIFISNLLSSSVRVYSRQGEFLGLLGPSSVGESFFNLPVGLWVDPVDRLFVSENNNSRVQVFQLPVPAIALPAVTR